MVDTDYPHPDAHMNFAQSVQTLSSISTEAYEGIAWENAERLFGLEDTCARSLAAEWTLSISVSVGRGWRR